MTNPFTSLKFRNTVNTGLVVLGLFLYFSGKADAAFPKSHSIVHNSEITVGDVFEGVPAEHKGFVLAPAPAPGEKIALNAAALNRISNVFQLNWSASDAADHIVIERAATIIDTDLIKKALRAELQAEYGLKASDEIEMLTRNVQLVLPGDNKGGFTLEEVSYDKVRGNFSAHLVTDDKKHSLNLAGRVHQMIEVPVLSNRLRNGDVIGKRDIEWVTMRVNEIDSTVITDADNLIGQTPRRTMASLKPVRLSDVHAPLLVSRGDTVTIELDNDTLNLTTRGRALESGAHGEIIRVMNMTSKRIVEGTVAGSQKVNVTSQL